MNIIFRPTTLLAIIALILSATLLFQVKHDVLVLRKELAQLERDIRHANEDLHVLKAEWGYLTQPENIARLAKTHLHLQTAETVQIRNLKRNELHKISTSEDVIS